MEFKKEKNVYCKHCGLELERGLCVCDESKKSAQVVNEKIKCDTCHKKIDADAKFCPFCGIQVGENIYKHALKRELKGDFEPDVLAEIKRRDMARFDATMEKVFPQKTRKIISILALVLVFLIAIKCALIIKDLIIADEAKYLENTEETIKETGIVETTEARYSVIEDKAPDVSMHKSWIKQDGFIYCLNKDGDPVIDEWVEEIDSHGNSHMYYFDIDGRLVVNSWIDGEYYVGSNGEMYLDRMTPDGAYVDEDGRVVVEHKAEAVAVEKETRVFYDAPGPDGKVKASSNQKSSSQATIKGVDATKTYELYIKEIKPIRENYVKNNEKCSITYYYPIIAGGKEKEVNKINELIVDMFVNRFFNTLCRLTDENNRTPKSIHLNTVDQRQLNENRFIFIISGKLVPQSGMTEKKKYRFIYDRKSKTLDMLDISDY